MPALLRKNIPFHDKYGDLYLTGLDEFSCNNKQGIKLDDIIVRCKKCGEMIGYNESVCLYRSTKEEYAFCSRCAEEIFGV